RKDEAEATRGAPAVPLYVRVQVVRAVPLVESVETGAEDGAHVYFTAPHAHSSVGS
ncbi:hypothetical protein BaRGS_00039440, partial [Batillaria attramentaria]